MTFHKTYKTRFQKTQQHFWKHNISQKHKDISDYRKGGPTLLVYDWTEPSQFRVYSIDVLRWVGARLDELDDTLQRRSGSRKCTCQGVTFSVKPRAQTHLDL